MSLVSILLDELSIFFSNKNTIRYTKIFSNLSKQDKKFVLAMAQSSNERVTIKEIREKLDRPSNFIANYRRRLLDDEIIKATNYGEVAFTLPFFKEYILQQYRFEQEMDY